MVAQSIPAMMNLFEKIPEILTSPIVLGVGFLMVLALAIGLRPARFTSKAVLNKTERRLFDMLVRVVRDMRPDARVLAQVSYGEFLRSKNKKAFWSINARRADFLIVDAEFAPLAVVEYQGRGHFGSSRRAARAARQGDRIKARACRSAGIEWIEIPERFTVAEVQQLLQQALTHPAVEKEREPA